MSDGDTTDLVDHNDEPTAVYSTDSKDWFLQSIIETAIAAGVEIGMTVTVGGTTVSGILINGKKYFEELGDLLEGSSRAEGDMQSVLGSAWRKFTAIYEKPEDSDDSWQPSPAAYIHLKNAFFHAPGQSRMPSNTGVLWRGKLSAIDGFSIGNFSQE